MSSPQRLQRKRTMDVFCYSEEQKTYLEHERIVSPKSINQEYESIMKVQQLRQEEKKRRTMFRNLTGFLDKKEKQKLRFCVALSVLSPLVEWFNVYALILILGNLDKLEITKGLFWQIIFLGTIYLLKGGYDLLRRRTLDCFSKNLAHTWSVKIYELCSKEELLEHNQRSSVQQLASVRTDTKVSAKLMVVFINRTAQVVTFLGYFFLMAYQIHWLGVVVCLLVTAMIVLVQPYCARLICQYSEKSRESDIQANFLVSIAYRSYKEMRVGYKVEDLLEKYRKISEEYAQVQMKAAFMTEHTGILAQSIIQSGTFFLVAFLLASGIDLSLFWADMIVCVTILIQAFPNVLVFFGESNWIQFGRENYEVFCENMRRYCELKEKEEKEWQLRLKPLTFKKGLRIEHLTFQYPNGNEIFKDVSVEIPAEHSTAIIGASGIGKTTFLDLILGLLPVKSGHIWYDDFDLVARRDSEGPCRADLGSVVSYIPQFVFMNGDTVRNNVVFMAEDEDEERIISCLKHAQIWEDVKRMPDGLDTLIGEDGMVLSGGQRQRIAIARALYKDFELLIMDEATASLDEATERAVMSNLEQIEGNKTILLLTHHLALAERCEFVYKIEGKKLVRVK